MADDPDTALLEQVILTSMARFFLIWLLVRLSHMESFFFSFLSGVAVFACVKSLYPIEYPGEPRYLESTVPVVGHLWSLLTDQVKYFGKLYAEHRQPEIATLPIATRKLYVIFDSAYQQAALKAKEMDAQSFMVDFVPRIFGVRQGTVDKLLGKDGVHPNIMSDMEGVFNHALSGERLHLLVVKTLEEVGKTFNQIDNDQGIVVPNLFVWLRNLVTKATSTALWGENHNPYKDQEVIDSQWDFEANMGPLVLGVLPRIIARKAYLARARLQAALKPFYRARHDQNDPSVSAFVRERSKLLRKYDLPDDELAKNEISITLVATTNALSTLFWCVAEIFTRPDLLAEISEEVHHAVFNAAAAPGGSQVPASAGHKHNNKLTVSINAKSLLEEHCPLLNSCYREAIRLASQIVTTRRVLEDMWLTPSGSYKSGSETLNGYFLKAGINVLMPAKVVHRDKLIWGDDADEFNPWRFVTPATPGPDETASEAAARMRRMKSAFVPFGGGKHLCPGRHYAFLENLSIMAALVLGYEIVGLDKTRLKMGDSNRGETAKPVPGFEGGQVVIKRREGWENVDWQFRCE